MEKNCILSGILSLMYLISHKESAGLADLTIAFFVYNNDLIRNLHAR